jgi:hypothetical protein
MQNVWLWSDKNPHTIQQVQLHNVKVIVWYAVNAEWIIHFKTSEHISKSVYV